MPSKKQLIEELEPWETKVDGDSLFKEVVNIINKYTVLPKEMAHLISLWVFGSYCFDEFRIFPILALISPDKRCGKTTLLSIISALSNKAIPTSNISSASIYRIIDKYSPTLLIDEADTFLDGNNEMRGILNSGHCKDTSYVLRSSGENYDPQHFNSFSPKVIAKIGELEETLDDRSLVIRMKRKMPHENCETLPSDPKSEFKDIRRMILRWANDNIDSIRKEDVSMPSIKNDRYLDNIKPLLLISKVINVECYLHAFEVFKNVAPDQESIITKLLVDIKKIFQTKKVDKIASEDLILELKFMENSPWSENPFSMPLTASRLAKLLRPFNVRPQTIRLNNEITRKGYTKSMFNEVFERYTGLE